MQFFIKRILMKNILILLVLLVPFTLKTQAQWTTSGSNIYYNGGGDYRGNVSVGTSLSDAKLRVDRDQVLGQGYVFSGYSSNLQWWTGIGLGRTSQDLAIGVAGNVDHFADGARQGDLIFRATNAGSRMLFNSTRNATAMIIDGTKIGMGTFQPISRLDLGGHLMSNPAGTESPTISLWKTSGNQSLYGFGVSSSTLNYFAHQVHSFYTSDGAGGNRIAACFINPQGMGIGLNPALPLPGNGDYKLVVKGKVWATEVKVAVAGLGDYVFSPAYRLRPLTEVDAYIKQNGHLPEVPSAAEVAKEGMNVGEMENTLLKKIEELTLYLIELQKENEQQARQIGQLSRKRKFKH